MHSHRMNKLKIVLFLLLAVALTTPLYTQKTNIAILQFDAENITGSEARILSDRLRTELLKIGAFNVVDRSAMEEILQEQGFQQTGCVSDECIVEVGKLVGVELMVGGSIGKIGTIYTISARMIDVKTGKILSQQSLDCPCPIETLLTESMGEVAAGLSGAKIVKPIIPPPPAVGSALFTSQEENVTILVNGEVKGTTPLTLSDLEPGQHSFAARKSGFRDYTGQYTIEADGMTEISIPLIWKAGTLSILASRPGQKFDFHFGGEIYEGIGSKQLSLGEGDYTFTIKEYGYQDLTQKVSIGDRRAAVVKVVNKPVMVPAYFTVYPSLATVTINGKVTEISSGNLTLPFGQTYTVTAKAPKYSTEQSSFEIKEIEDVKVDLLLSPKSKVTTGVLSTLIPGSGQFYSDNSKKGLIFMVASVGLAAVLNGANSNYQEEHSLMEDYQQDYQNATDPAYIAATWEIYQDQVNTVNDVKAQLVVYGVVLGATWIANTLDAWFFNGIPDE